MSIPNFVDSNTYVYLSKENLSHVATNGSQNLDKDSKVNYPKGIEDNMFASDQSGTVRLAKIDNEEDDLETYCEILRNCPCPICNSASNKINASITATTVSFLLFTDYQKSLKIACPNCLNKMHNEAMLKSSLLGWWGLPWGIFRTIEALLLNYKMKFITSLPEPNELFKNFVASRIDHIKANRNNREGLKSIVLFNI